MHKFSTIRNSALAVAVSFVTLFSYAPIVQATTTTSSSQLSSVVTKGNMKIDQRMTTLQKLNAKVSAMTVVTAPDKTALTAQINDSASGLTNLRAKLNADKSVKAAHDDYDKIYTDYRVYMVIAPKVSIIKVADDQQAKATIDMATVSLAQLYVSGSGDTALQTQLQTKLADVSKKATDAYLKAQSVSAAVLQLRPSDYNQNHQVMTNYLAQLKANKVQLTAAYNELKAIVIVLNDQG